MNHSSSILVPLGAGIAVGVVGLWAIFELLPVIALVGGGWLIVKGMKSSVYEETECETGPKKKSTS